MKVLIVYENIPESTDMFIVEANERDLFDLKLSHGNYANACDNDDIEQAMARLSIRLADEKPFPDTVEWCGSQAEDIGKWSGCKVDGSSPVIVTESGIEMVIVTGFCM